MVQRILGFWVQGIFYLRPEPPDKLHSITSRTAYWAGGINILKRGEPASVPMQSVNDISAAVKKATWVRALHGCAERDILISAERDMLRPLERSSKYAKKPFGGREDKMKRDVMHNEALQDPQAPRRLIPTWAELLHDVVNHARDMGWENHRKSPNTEMWEAP